MAEPSGFRITGQAAEAYERWNAPLMAPFVEALVDAAGLAPGGAVVDLACGTGFVARAAAARVGPSGRVVGVDPNAGMLAVASSAAAGVAPTIEWCQAAAGQVPLPDGAFDAVLCQQGMQFFADRHGAVADAARLLRPDGVLAATVWAPVTRSPFFAAQAGAVDALLDPAQRASFAGAFACRAIDLDDACSAAGLRDIAVHELAIAIRVPDALRFVRGQWDALPWGAALAAARPDGVETAARLMVEVLGPYLHEDGSLEAPFTAVLVTGRR
jgi:SAM-dependent methyltransferase